MKGWTFLGIYLFILLHILVIFIWICYNHNWQPKSMEIKPIRMSILYPQYNFTEIGMGEHTENYKEKLPFPCQSSRLLTILNYSMVIELVVFLLWLETKGIASTAQFNSSQEEFVQKQWWTFNVNLIFIIWIHFPEVI